MVMVMKEKSSSEAVWRSKNCAQTLALFTGVNNELTKTYFHLIIMFDANDR